jgi:rhodanese-related sulfurtransferase
MIGYVVGGGHGHSWSRAFDGDPEDYSFSVLYYETLRVMLLSPMPRPIPAPTLKSWLSDGAEIALVDVREAGPFGEGHLFFAVPLPYSRFELGLPALVPNVAVRLVLVDHGDGVAERAAARAEELGYSNVHVLEGGVAAWRRAGFTLYAGVNVPSKTFGELVEHARGTPRVSAAALKLMQDKGDNVVVIDGRPLAEYRKMNIPGGICCPNGELALRIRAIAPDPATTIVVNCAGRTRSIIGAQTLIDLGLPNPVFALENGTQGWFLAGLALEHGAERSYEDFMGASAGDVREAADDQRKRARALAERHNVAFVAPAQVQAWLEEGRTQATSSLRHREVRAQRASNDDRLGPSPPDQVRGRLFEARLRRAPQGDGTESEESAELARQIPRTTYLLDVRTEKEFAAGAVPGFAHAPGGQLIQATDQWVGVKGARVVLVDDEMVRAPVVAAWLRQLGHEAYVVEGGVAAARGVITGRGQVGLGDVSARLTEIASSHSALLAMTDEKDSSLRGAEGPEAIPVKEALSPHDLAAALAEGRVQVIDLRSSMAYRKGHIPQAVWSIRPRVVADAVGSGVIARREAPKQSRAAGDHLTGIASAGSARLAMTKEEGDKPGHDEKQKPIVLIADDPFVAALAARDLAEAGFTDLRDLAGGYAAWCAAALPVAATPDWPADKDCIDFLFFTHGRHEGNAAAARQYLAWEQGLVGQLDAQERAVFRVG